MEAADNEESRKVVDFLHAVEQAKQCKSMLEEEKLAELIALNQLSLQHIPIVFLERSLNVWKALYRQMPMGGFISGSCMSKTNYVPVAKPISTFIFSYQVC
jgi:hypothetical protein